MATPVIMPKFGMAQEDGTILRWLKQEGDHVDLGETLLEVQTDKVDMEVEAPASGVLRDVRFGVDATVPVTTVIAVITDTAEEARIAGSDSPRQAARVGDGFATAQAEPQPHDARVSPIARRVAEEEGVDLSEVQGTGAEGRVTRADVERAAAVPSSTRVAATPAARRVAREVGMDLGTVTGSGPGGRVQVGDVATLLASGNLKPSAAAPAAATPVLATQASVTGVALASQTDASSSYREPLRGKRRTIATRLSQSWHSAPHIFLTTRVEMTQAEALREVLGAEVAEGGAKLTVTVILARAVAAALSRRPRMNAWLHEEGGELLLEERLSVNLGVAVALPDGLIVPVVPQAQTLGLLALAQRVGDLSARARSGQLAPDEVSSGTFTLSNLGMYPIDHFTAIINPPQVAILACGRMQMQPVWDGSQFHPRPVLQLTLSADHRAVDGAEAGAFLAEVKAYLESPQRLLL